MKMVTTFYDHAHPTTDGRTFVFTRYTQPEKDHQLLLQQLKLRLPPQPPPRIAKPKAAQPVCCVVPTFNSQILIYQGVSLS
jgi:hypothetical protein